jgi:DNA-binding NtrC family response regulator
VRRIGAAAFEKLKRYNFPGNVRELRNLIERALILSSGIELGPDDFPLAGVGAENRNGDLSWLASTPDAVNLRDFLEQVEKNLIERALRFSQGVQAEAARRQLSRSDLGYKLSKYGIRADKE